MKGFQINALTGEVGRPWMIPKNVFEFSPSSCQPAGFTEAIDPSIFSPCIENHDS
jgi:hypothetical protein